MEKPKYTTEPGDLLAIMITGMTAFYIAEVVENRPMNKIYPLVLKVEESGPYSRLKGEDFIIMEADTLKVQGTEVEQQQLLQEAFNRGKAWQSGLHVLGVTDGKLHEIYPAEKLIINEGLYDHLENIAKTMGFNNWDRLCLSGEPNVISDCVEMAVNNWNIKQIDKRVNEAFRKEKMFPASYFEREIEAAKKTAHSEGYTKGYNDHDIEESYRRNPEPGY